MLSVGFVPTISACERPQNYAYSAQSLFELLAFVQCVRKVAVHLQKVPKVMYTGVYTGLNPFNPFNFIRKSFLQICVRKVAVHL
jgi:predicted TIM-barrel enzyme